MPFRARLNPASLSRRRSVPDLDWRPAPYPCYCPSSSRQYGTLRDRAFFTSQPGPSVPSAAALSQIRHKSTNASSPLDAISSFFSFGRRKGSSDRPSLQKAPIQFMQAIEEEDTKKLREAYTVITEAIDSSPNPQQLAQSYLQSEDLIAALNLLSISHTVPADGIEFLRKMYADVTRRFGYDLEMGHHGAMGIGLSRSGRVSEALELLKALNPENVEWTELLRAAVQFDRDAVKSVYETMKNIRPLTTEDYDLLALDVRLRIREKQAGRAELEQLRREMGEIEKDIGIEGQSDLFRSYVLLNDVGEAQRIAEYWDKAEVGYHPSRWKALCELARLEGDKEKLERLCLDMRGRGDDPITISLYALVLAEYGQNGDWVAAVDEVERKLGLDLNDRVWAAIIEEYFENADQVQQSPRETHTGAINLYKAAKSRGVDTTPALAKILIVRLCKAQQLNLKAAVAVYNDLKEAEIQVEPSDKFMPRIYRHLLQGCAAHDTPAAVFQSINLLEDMAKGGVTFLKPITSTIIRLVRSAPDHKTAYQIYTQYYVLTASTFTEEIFLQFITAILLRRAESDIAPPEMVLDMMKHMYACGIRPGSFVLTSLLHYYGQLATSKPDSNLYRQQHRQDDILKLIQELHTRIKLDPMINIDIPLLNALMNAYQRVGDARSALTQWNILVERRSREDPDVARQYYPGSVSIALDVCGRNNLSKKADQIWAWAQRHEFTYKVSLWYDYVECLCRLGQFDRALSTVFEEMRDGRDGAPPPDIEIVRILAKFSLNINNAPDVLVSSLRQTYPEWLEEIREILSVTKAGTNAFFGSTGEASAGSSTQPPHSLENGPPRERGGPNAGLTSESASAGVLQDLEAILEEEKARLEGDKAHFGVQLEDETDQDPRSQGNGDRGDRTDAISSELEAILQEEKVRLDLSRTTQDSQTPQSGRRSDGLNGVRNQKPPV